jgi:cellulose synthase/poly-beta-1,6-N-acetylglucosamine synthase-like glycosyltransferase
MSNKAQVFILCEDTVHYHFARKYFELLGFNSRKIRGKYNPKGRSIGSGAEYVKESYEKEIKAFHSKNYMDYILVVIIDDDTKDNVKYLYQKYAPLQNEPILIFSPLRNIESWFCFIDTDNFHVENKDEQGKIIDYKSQYKNSKPTEFAKKLKNEICINGLPENAPASLRHACDELKRLKN